VTDRLTTPPKRLRVLVVDDSSICRESLRAILEADGDIEVVGEGEDGFSALGLIESLSPDLVTMDVQMPGKSGLETVEEIMSRRPVPIIVVTAENLGDESGVAFTAVENGALEVVAKPSLLDDEAGASLRSMVRAFATVPVFRRVESRSPTARPAADRRQIEMIGVAAGRGGIASVLGLLSRLPAGLMCPLVLYEPVPPELVPSYTKHLGRICKLPVRLAAMPESRCALGEVLFVPALRAEWTRGGAIRLEAGAPSANHFFGTLGEIYGARAAGIVLAGSGNDGAVGLGSLSHAGGQTFAESPTRDVVSGMPMAAIESGAAGRACSVEQMVAELLELLPQ
jgi:two-component system chemotaxis response regulator CheB